MRATLVRNAWRWKCGLPEQHYETKTYNDISAISETQGNKHFEELRKNRMVVGFFRYGNIRGNKIKYDNVRSAIIRLNKYLATGNAEHLVDVANLCMIEFTQENHKHFHFDSEDDGEHTREIL